MVLAQRAPFLFTAAQILRGAPLSVLHFFSPLGAGGAGAAPRRVRAAYSRTRCLPHPKGWASTPTGLFCVARTYCSYHTFPRTSYLSALRAEVDSIYPAVKSNLSIALCLVILPSESAPKNLLAEGSKHCGEAGALPTSPHYLLHCCSEISGAELRSGTIAHKGPITAFYPFGGVRAPQKGHKPPHNAKQGPSRF